MTRYELQKTLQSDDRYFHVIFLYEGDSTTASRRVILEMPNLIAQSGEYIYRNYEQAAGPVDGTAALKEYRYVTAMAKGSMMRPSANIGAALALGLGSGGLHNAATRIHGERVVSVELSAGVIEAAVECFGFCGTVIHDDAYNVVMELEKGQTEYSTIYQDIFSLTDDNEVNIPGIFLEKQYLQQLYDVLPDNGMFVANMSDSAIGQTQHAAVREALQFLGERFQRVWVSKVLDTDEAGNLVIACLKKEGDLKDFYLADEFNEREKELGRVPSPYDKKISFQLFHPFGTFSTTPAALTDPYRELTATDEFGVPTNLWSEYGAYPQVSMSYHAQFMADLAKRMIDVSDCSEVRTRVLRNENARIVGLIPYYTTPPCSTEDGKVVYVNSVLGEEAAIHYEPVVDPDSFIASLRMMPPYISQDISPHYSDRVWKALRTHTNPMQVLYDNGVCLFEYETTKLRPIDELYALMQRDDRKEAQRLCRKVHDRFDVTFESKMPYNDPSWVDLRENYLAYRQAADDKLVDGHTYLSSVEGTYKHLLMCEHAQEAGLLRTLVFRDKATKKIVAVNCSILHPASETVGDVMCIRHTADEWKPYGLGVVAILLNYNAVWHNTSGIKWYDLGNMGTENTYKYKQMFFTDMCFRFGVAMASDSMLIEATMKNSGYIFPILFRTPDEGMSVIRNADEALDAFMRLPLENVREALRYYSTQPPTSITAFATKIIERLEHIVAVKEARLVRESDIAAGSSTNDGEHVLPA